MKHPIDNGTEVWWTRPGAPAIRATVNGQMYKRKTMYDLEINGERRSDGFGVPEDQITPLSIIELIEDKKEKRTT